MPLFSTPLAHIIANHFGYLDIEGKMVFFTGIQLGWTSGKINFGVMMSLMTPVPASDSGTKLAISGMMLNVVFWIGIQVLISHRMESYKAFSITVFCCMAVLVVTGTENLTKRWTFQNSTYELNTADELEWVPAKNDCRMKGMRLVSIESVDEYYSILEVIAPFNLSIWISGSDEGQEGKFYWEATGQLIGPFTTWYPGEPNNLKGNEHCMMMPGYQYYLWNDEDCDVLANYICEGYLCS
ncbi:Hypothetical predicted protein [Cloeon dipterum]|uniref:C-type lectin domain-containing protein n=1 Tax=Cloeon dipterum TaxID=197152 RepID=A0A8S1DM28_9INSE|nr:Hypothetical predicted protein [Cloeon dipterum]